MTVYQKMIKLHIPAFDGLGDNRKVFLELKKYFESIKLTWEDLKTDHSRICINMEILQKKDKLSVFTREASSVDKRGRYPIMDVKMIIVEEIIESHYRRREGQMWNQPQIM